MSEIGDSMKKRGFVPLADDGLGGIGIKPKINEAINMTGFKPVWFEIGLTIKDAESNDIARTVCATDLGMYNEYLKKPGWKPLESEAEPQHESKGVSGSTGKKKKGKR